MARTEEVGGLDAAGNTAVAERWRSLVLHGRREVDTTTSSAALFVVAGGRRADRRPRLTGLVDLAPCLLVDECAALELQLLDHLRARAGHTTCGLGLGQQDAPFGSPVVASTGSR